MNYLLGSYTITCMNIVKTLTLILLIAFSNLVLAAAPKLNFSDLISGPATGLGDGLGSGAVVTVWGQHLGDNKGGSTISFTDSQGNTHQNIHTYYWKNADGQLPSGPANLFESHKMQEIALSIPLAASGPGLISVTVNGNVSNTLPFTVRNGDIYHIMTSGSDNSGDGSFSNPWETISKALTEIEGPGASVYVHDSISTGDASTKRAVYWNKVSAASGYSNQYGVIAYPNSQPIVIGRLGIVNYRVSGQVVSKFSTFTSNCDEDANGQLVNCDTNPSKFTIGIQTSAYGRIVANKLTDVPGRCSSGRDAAINGNNLSSSAKRVFGNQILGNEIYEYGCEGSAKFHHATYISIRSGSDNDQVDPWRFGWNYLHDNDVKNGIHQYDENNNGLECGSPNGTVIINDNVIINQGGSGINVGANCPWNNDFDIYNNIIINAGLPADWDGSNPNTSNGAYTSGITIQDGGLMGTMRIHNNTIHTWDRDGINDGAKACLGLLGSQDNVAILFNNNACYTGEDKDFVNHNWNGAQLMDNVTGNNNSWFYTGASPTNAIPPSWNDSSSNNGAILSDPLLAINQAQIGVDANSPLIGVSTTTLTHDVYGTPRPQNSTVGAIEFIGEYLIFKNSFE